MAITYTRPQERRVRHLAKDERFLSDDGDTADVNRIAMEVGLPAATVRYILDPPPPHVDPSAGDGSDEE